MKMRRISSLLLLTLIVVMTSVPAFAHKMVIEPQEGNVIKVTYDGGNPATRAKVKAFDKGDQLIFEEQVDEEGNVEYPKEAAYLEADDGMGHKDSYTVGGSVEKSSGGDSKLVKIGIVLVAFVAIGVFFNKKKAK